MQKDVMYTQAAIGGALQMVVNMPDRDFELVRLSSGGDTLAFKELYERNVGRIYALCLRITANEDLADELTQEVFIKAWEKIKTFGYQSRFSTWLHSIAMNTFLMMKRTEKRFSEKLNSLGQLINRNNSVHAGHRWDSNIDLENAIAGLPEKMRAAFVLHDVEGYKHREISKMLDIETGTSKAHLHHARKILRDKLLK